MWRALPAILLASCGTLNGYTTGIGIGRGSTDGTVEDLWIDEETDFVQGYLELHWLLEKPEPRLRPAPHFPELVQAQAAPVQDVWWTDWEKILLLVSVLAGGGAGGYYYQRRRSNGKNPPGEDVPRRQTPESL